MKRAIRRQSLLILFVWALIVGLSACADDSGGTKEAGVDRFAYQNLLFPNVIQISQPVMTPGHSQPTVSWPATNEAHVVCAIFSERIGVRDSHITNPEKIVWIWHSGLGTGREGNVLYEHGRSSPSSTTKPSPLAKGTYYWAVWALNEEGLPSYASREFVHTVK